VAAATKSFPLASAPYVISSSIRVCGVMCGHNEHWFSCPRHTPILYGGAQEGSAATRMTDTLNQGMDEDPSINGRSHS
jgi:hypothetical protein